MQPPHPLSLSLFCCFSAGRFYNRANLCQEICSLTNSNMKVIMWQWCLLDCDTVSQLTLSACEFAKNKNEKNFHLSRNVGAAGPLARFSPAMAQCPTRRACCRRSCVVSEAANELRMMLRQRVVRAFIFLSLYCISSARLRLRHSQ